MFFAFSKLYRTMPLAVLLICAAGPAGAQQSASPTAAAQQSPAPVVRVRPRRPAPTTENAPPDAAPLVNGTPRVRPVNPQALSGVVTQAPAPVVRVPEPTQGAAAKPAGTAESPAPTAHKSDTSSAGAEPPADKASVLARMAPPAFNRNVIVLDPGHGGSDSGSRIGDRILEKNVTLAFALRLRTLLAARGFTVVMTRDADRGSAGEALSLDDRAGIANHAGAVACLSLHATGRGDGVHLYTSELAPAPGTLAEQPWLTAQAPWVPSSQGLERGISTALGRSHIALVSSAASVRPMDSLACPALILEIAPENGKPASVNDTGYQDRIAGAIAGALVFWPSQVQPPGRAGQTPVTHGSRRRHDEQAGKTDAKPAVKTEAKP